MESLCRVMYELHQDYFAYLHQVAIDAPAIVVPTFQDVVNQVATGRVARLSALPHGRYASFEGRPETGTGRGGGTGTGGGGGSGGGSGGSLRERSGTTPRVNPKPDAALLTRFRDCGHASINSMIGDHVVECPKHAGEDVCLSWALKGQCSDNCKRKKQHVQYGRPVIQKLHALMDVCGVANPQP
jgi:hypothetical protein